MRMKFFLIPCFFTASNGFPVMLSSRGGVFPESIGNYIEEEIDEMFEKDWTSTFTTEEHLGELKDAKPTIDAMGAPDAKKENVKPL